jgi:hypothetical protein
LDWPKFGAGRAENGDFREPQRSVLKYVSSGSAEKRHLQAGMG